MITVIVITVNVITLFTFTVIMITLEITSLSSSALVNLWHQLFTADAAHTSSCQLARALVRCSNTVPPPAFVTLGFIS